MTWIKLDELPKAVGGEMVHTSEARRYRLGYIICRTTLQLVGKCACGGCQNRIVTAVDPSGERIGICTIAEFNANSKRLKDYLDGRR